MVHFKGKFSLFAIYLFYFRNLNCSQYLNVLQKAISASLKQ